MRSLTKSILMLGVACMLLGPANDTHPAFAANNEQVAITMQEFFDSGLLSAGKQDNDERLIELYNFYESRNFKPIWTRDNGPKFKAKDLLKALKAAEEHGLNPNDYDIEGIEARMGETHPEDLAELELIISDAFSQFVHHLSAGRVKPSAVNSAIKLNPQAPAPLTLITGAEAAHSIDEFLDAVKPQTPRYVRMQEALAGYRRIAASGGWPKIADGPTLKPGMDDARVETLRKVLTVMGDLKQGEAGQGTTYDDALVEGVKRFQERHGRNPDGVIGPSTLAALQVPVETRVEQLVLNLERRRWMQNDFGGYYVFVNLADQNLKVVEVIGAKEQTIHDARVVVGKAYDATPVFTKDMSHLVFNPYWNVPQSIANKEYLPKLKRDPGALKSQRIRLFTSSGDEVDPYSVNWAGISKMPYRLRQDTGEKNALGRIKFMFPNRYNIYIHDTPSKSLFAKEKRTFSHGCIRVEDPQALATVLLSRQGWNAGKVSSQVDSQKRRIVKLDRKIPVHIAYLTAWVNKDGSVNFRRDVYGRDKRLAKFLFAEQ